MCVHGGERLPDMWWRGSSLRWAKMNFFYCWLELPSVWPRGNSVWSLWCLPPLPAVYPLALIKLLSCVGHWQDIRGQIKYQVFYSFLADLLVWLQFCIHGMLEGHRCCLQGVQGLDSKEVNKGKLSWTGDLVLCVKHNVRTWVWLSSPCKAGHSSEHL